LFDSRYEYLFLRRALHEGLVTGSKHKRKEIVSVAGNAPEPYMEKTMLQMLLLYEKCLCLGARDPTELNFTKVEDELGLISFIPVQHITKTFSTVDALALKDILLSEVNVTGSLLTKEDFDIAIQANPLTEAFDVIEKYKGRDDALKWLSESAPSDNPVLPYGILARNYILRAQYLLLKEHLEWSDKLQVPLLKAFRYDNFGKKLALPDRRTHQRIEDGKCSRLVLGIFFGKTRLVLPKVESLQDVIELRGDKRIVDFRGKIFSWVHDLQDGRVNLKEIEQEMIDARNNMKTIGKCSKIGTWLTFLSIPVTIASTITHLPFGAPFSVASIGLATTSQLLRRRYRWYLFGIG
jgi:hypothetical protein